MAPLRTQAVAVLLLACFSAAHAWKYATAWEALSANKDVSVFTHVAEVAGLKPYMQSKYTAGTIFAPTNAAIAAFLKRHSKTAADMEAFHNSLMVDRIISTHLVLDGGMIVPSKMADGVSLQTLAHVPLIVSKGAGGIKVTAPQGSAKVVGSDYSGGKVQIYVIDNVLLPGTVFSTIKAALAFSPSTSKLAKLIAADPVLAKAASDPTTNVTLFAPVNKALAAVAASSAGAALLADPSKLHKVLAYHAAPGARILPHFSGSTSLKLPTLLTGADVTVSKVYSKGADGSKVGVVEVLANSAGAKPVNIKKHNIIAGASLIDIIDGVLVPKL